MQKSTAQNRGNRRMIAERVGMLFLSFAVFVVSLRFSRAITGVFSKDLYLTLNGSQYVNPKWCSSPSNILPLLSLDL
ncbi:hypothetical protein DL96DRAFT_1579227 [Flagelloscypha sp. PMI_526]|nr:hypothetical protein DL96DRAFT_1579227 [Flagelloscypha sp. PMI_526]